MTKKLDIFSQVRALEGWKAVAYSAALLERMLPNYELFDDVNGLGGYVTLRHCLDLVWTWLTDPKQKINFAVHLEKVELLTPDPAAFDAWGVFPAVDAAIGLAACVQLVLGEDPQGAVVVSKLSQGSVEAFLFATEQADETDVKQHPLMQFELALQQSLLFCLAQGESRAHVLSQLKQLALEDEVSNIGLEIASPPASF